MCGIAAILSKEKDKQLQFVTRANNEQAHRGPDASGTLLLPDIALAHRRLAIIDLSNSADQPMQANAGRYSLVYNGEIYNFLERRRQLSNRWNFETHSDTEVLLAALVLDGVGALEKFVGMWALLFWDNEKKELLVSRDRFGQKPLYVRRYSKNTICFASEIKPLLYENEKPRLNLNAAADYLATGAYGHRGVETFFDEITSFPPGTWAIWDKDTNLKQEKNFWVFPKTEVNPCGTYSTSQIQSFRSTFKEAVLSQTIADVPIGVALSGGLDSSAIVGMLASEGAKEPITVFTAQASQSAGDESQYVRAVMEKWPGRLRLLELESSQLNLQTLLPEVLYAQEEPFGDPSILAHYSICKSAHQEGIKVLLGGQGGDEILFGYPFMSTSVLASAMRQKQLLWTARQAWHLKSHTALLVRSALAAFSTDAEIRLRNKQHAKKRTWLSERLLNQTIPSTASQAALADMNGFWRDALQRWTLPHLLHYDDRNTMRFSIEGRTPFLDHRLLELIVPMDKAAFLRDGMRKVVLRDACKDLIPETVLRRRDKIGFHTPTESLIRREAIWVGEMITSDRMRNLDLWKMTAVKADINKLKSRRGDGETRDKVWRALAMSVWAEQFSISV